MPGKRSGRSASGGHSLELIYINQAVLLKWLTVKQLEFPFSSVSFKINKPPESEKKQFSLSKGFVSGCLQNQEHNASVYQHTLISYSKNFLHNHNGQHENEGRLSEKNLTVAPKKS